MKKLGIGFLFGAYAAFIMGGLPMLTDYTVVWSIIAAVCFLTAYTVDIFS